MDIRKEQITEYQVLFLTAAFINGSVLVISFAGGISGRNTWIALIAADLFCTPFLLTYSSLSARFAGLNLVQIICSVYGGIAGRIISVFYIIFFSLTLSFNFRDLSSLYTTFFLPDTPSIFFITIIAALCSYLAWCGIEVMGRISLIFVVVSVLTAISTSLMLSDKMDFANLMPFLNMPLIDMVHSVHVISAIPFGELIVILVLFSSAGKPKSITRNFYKGFLIGTAVLLVVSIRNTAVLGSTESILSYSSFQAVRLIDIGNVFTRMDLLIGIAQTVALFFKCSIFMYALTASASQLLSLKSYRPLILPIAGFEVVLAATVYQSSTEQSFTSINTGIIYLIPLLFIIPPLTLFIAKVRRLPK
jgi:spore germination protein KB